MKVRTTRQYNDDWLLFYRKNKLQVELLLIDLGDHNSISRIISQNK